MSRVAVVTRVVDDGETRRKRDPGANVSVQRAHTLLEDSLLVVHGDRDIQDGCGFGALVVHEIQRGAAVLDAGREDAGRPL